MGKKILVVVDYQYDFFNPDGALYVNGGEKLYDKIVNIIPEFDFVVFTQDCHPYNHCSFIDNGGIWPIHCVEDSIGAGIPIELFKKAKNYAVIKKGTNSNEEEYGAFSNIKSFNDAVHGAFFDSVTTYRYFRNNNEFINNTEIVICGIAGDYCVLETLKNIIKHIGANKVSVYLDGIVSIDGGEKLNNFIKENDISVY